MSSLYRALSEPTINPELTEVALSLEAHADQVPEKRFYILLTDTGTLFSSLSKRITKNPYNHASIALDEGLEELYTYSLGGGVSKLVGGIEKESISELKGARYSLYELAVTTDVYNKVRDKIQAMYSEPVGSSYNHLGLINAVFQKEVFQSDLASKMFCSQFVVEVLSASGVELFKNRASSTVRPYDFVKSRLLKFVRRGTFR